MSDFTNYLFRPEYLTTSNKMNLGEGKYHLYVEDSSDVWFWESFIEKFYPNKYRVLPSSTRGKRTLESYYQNAKLEALIAVDSDYHYLLHNIPYSKELRENPYILHTYAYSKESVLLEKDYISSFFSSIKYTIPHRVDFKSFMSHLSQVIFNALALFAYYSNNKSITFDEKRFHNCLDITNKIEMVTINSSKELQVNYSLLNKLRYNFEIFFLPFTITLEEKKEAYIYLNSLGINTDNAYRFISGHKLEKIILTFQKQLMACLYDLEEVQIKKDFKDIQIRERLKQMKNELSESFKLKTYLRQYPSCINDEIHANIESQIKRIKVYALIST